MKNTPFIFLCLSAVFIVFPSNWLESTKTFFLTLVKPVGYFQTSPEKDKPKKLSAKDKIASLENDITDLKAEIVQLQNENNDLTKQLKSVADFIETQSATRIKEKYELITADVLINYDASIWRRSFLINRGSSDGIQPNLPVISGRYLIGKISSVSASTSKIQLITDPAFRSKVTLMPPKEEPPAGKGNDKKTAEKGGLQSGIGVLCGISFNQFDIKWVSRDIKIVAGWDIISSADIDNIFPKGLIIGKVSAVGEDGYFYTLRSSPAIDFYNLESVIILKPRKSH